MEKAGRYERSDEGSIPSSRAIYFGVGSSVGRTLVCGTGGRGIVTRPIPHTYAVLAHLVERDLAKVEATGSSPVYCSNTCVYRSGHNDLDLKSSVPTLIRLVGSNPTAHAKPKRAA